LWPPCNLCSLQACSGSLGLAGTARAWPGAFDRCVERALAPPPLCSSSISACSCGVPKQFFCVWPACHLQYAGLPRLPRAGEDGPRAACHARPIHRARIGFAAALFQLGFSVLGWGVKIVFLGVCRCLSVSVSVPSAVAHGLPWVRWGRFVLRLAPSRRVLSVSVMCEIQGIEVVFMYLYRSIGRAL